MTSEMNDETVTCHLFDVLVHRPYVNHSHKLTHSADLMIHSLLLLCSSRTTSLFDHLRPQPTRRTSWKLGLPTRCELVSN